MHELTLEEMELMSGEGWEDYVDVACGVVGVGALFFGFLLLPAAFCAGWGISRLL